MPRLYILCGLPFAGKSLFGKEMAEITGAEHVSFDAIWQEQSVVNPDITYEQNIKLVEEKLRNILSSGKSAIYDSTNLSEEHRANFANLAKGVAAEPVVIYLPVPVEVIKHRRAQSLVDKTHHEVSDENFNNALERIEVPKEGIILNTEEEKKDYLKTLTI